MKLALKFALPLLALFVSAAASAQNLDYSVTVSGSGSPVTFSVFAFSTGVSNPSGVTITSVKTAKGTLSPLSVQKAFDNSTASLQAACFAGTLLNTVELKGVDHVTQSLDIDILLTHVLISSDQIAGAQGESSAQESVTFTAARVTINGTQVNFTTVAGMQTANKMIAEIMQKAKSKNAVK